MYTDQKPAITKPNTLWAHLNAHKLPYFIALLLLVASIWLLMARLTDARKFESEKKQMDERLETIANNHLRLTAKTFSWAVRSAVMRGNYDQVREYFHDFIREEKIRSVALSDLSGKITICTDLNFEGKPASDLFPGGMADGKEIYIIAQDKNRIVSTPILSLNEPLGTLWWSFNVDSLRIVKGN